MNVYRSEADLFEALKTDSRFSQNIIIGIDGASGAGKTTLAEKLATELGSELLSFDDFVEPLKLTYVEALDFGQIKKAIAEKKLPLILEGICLDYVLEKIEINPTLKIYVSRETAWTDCYCHPSENLEDRLKSELESIRSFASIGAEHGGDQSQNSENVWLSFITSELLRYSHTYDPKRKADFIFQRPMKGRWDN